MEKLFDFAKFNKPMQFYEFLSHYGLVDNIYKAMANPDLAEVAMTVLDILLKTKSMPAVINGAKTEENSTARRKQGNKAFASKKYQEALVCYNMALLYAPKGSRALKLAYSNRSALLHSLTLFAKCLKDIDMCFKLGCPPDIIDKLKVRQETAKAHLWFENLVHQTVTYSFTKEYLKFEGRRNPQIPCATNNVGVVVENEVPKIVATADTRVGEVLAIENAFVSTTSRDNMIISCYYCQKLDLNLMPCHNCCVALFCSEECRENCIKEYHSYECKVIDMLEMISPSPMSVPRMATKAVLKMLSSSNSWKELVSESQVMGMQRIKNKFSIKDIFDVNSKFSLLYTKDEKHFLHGAMYNHSFSCAAIIHTLDSVGVFPQKSPERELSHRAFARIYMFLNLYCVPTEMTPAVTLQQHENLESHEVSNFAWFPFISKLGYSCTPNTIMVNLNRRQAIISVRPIKRGEPLTVMMVDSWPRKDQSERNYNAMSIHGRVCNCMICSGEYKLLPETPLSAVQKKSVKKLNMEQMGRQLHPNNAPEFFEKLCKALTTLKDVRFSKEYSDVYNLLRRCILYIQDAHCENRMIDYMG